VQFPDRITSRWTASLSDEQLQGAERVLHTAFLEQETAEKRRRGSRYEMMRGPSELLDAWHGWSMVNNEIRTRGLLVRRVR